RHHKHSPFIHSELKGFAAVIIIKISQPGVSILHCATYCPSLFWKVLTSLTVNGLPSNVKESFFLGIGNDDIFFKFVVSRFRIGSLMNSNTSPLLGSGCPNHPLSHHAQVSNR